MPVLYTSHRFENPLGVIRDPNHPTIHAHDIERVRHIVNVVSQHARAVWFRDRSRSDHPSTPALERYGCNPGLDRVDYQITYATATTSRRLPAAACWVQK